MQPDRFDALAGAIRKLRRRVGIDHQNAGVLRGRSCNTHDASQLTGKRDVYILIGSALETLMQENGIEP